MTELAYYRALSAIFYVIIAAQFYQKLVTAIHADKKKALAELCDDIEIDEHTMLAASKTAAAVLCIFWPAALLFAAYKKKGGSQ